MSGEDQEHFEDYLAVERYIEDLQAGRVAHVPAELTPELARIFRMAMFFHAVSSEASAPRPEFIAQLQAKLQQEEARHRSLLKRHRPRASSKERQAPPHVSRRALPDTRATPAASLSVGGGLDYALEKQKFAALTPSQPTPPSPMPPVPAHL